MNLLTLHCEPQLGKAALDDAARESLLAKLPDWTIRDGQLTKTFRFPDYYRTIAFVNALAFVAHREDHHPDLSVHYNRVVVNFSTHDAGGLTLNDFICAAKTDALVATA
ncbi:pterin-4-alpha-carbinolamine dehydratase [Crenobacter luteus]|uniref:Putative pterin-4-alpha-carbinolamine dehydratase n=1 Tax=Crenobacter luteus TaxID=1452487 RepID=A0A165EP00_9NEIS|nr:4a-hydroxytetrahydrobiopterin dehydratase [Crenobacter luteus]KZE27336.1 pterin dehydratase [Crenobacter luteus]TCP09378.1 pterin-4-alpha-carbinolamine dehydratase [Crenobacter luteus]